MTRRSIAFVEFALILPLMLVILFGVYDISEALITFTEVYDAAHSIPSSASVIAEQGATGSTVLSYDEIQFAESAIWADIPELRSGYKVSSSTAVTLTSVDFTPKASTCASTSSAGVYNSSPYYYNTNTCTYDAMVVWSVAYTASAGTAGSTFQQYVRPCVGVVADDIGLHQVASGTNIPFPTAAPVTPPTAAPSNAASEYIDILPTLTTSTATAAYPLESGPAPILVADVEYTFTPTFRFYFGGNALHFWATGLWPVRSAQTVYPSYSPSVTINTPPGTAVNARMPLSQQFTSIYGVLSSGTVTLYSALNDVPVQTYNASSSGTAEAGASSWCVNTYLSFPGSAKALAADPTNGEL